MYMNFSYINMCKLDKNRERERERERESSGGVCGCSLGRVFMFNVLRCLYVLLLLVELLTITV